MDAPNSPNPAQPNISPDNQTVAPTSNQTFQAPAPVPTNPTAANNLPPLPVAPVNQAFYHPELAPTYTPPKQAGKSHKTLIFGIILGILTAGVTFIWFILVPRTMAVSFVKDAKDIVTTGGDQTDKVNQALKSLYGAETNQGTNATLTSTQVLGAQTSANNQLSIFNSGLDLFNQALNQKSKGAVKGFSTPSSDPNKTDRDRRDMAVDIANKASDAQKSLDKLSVLLKKPIPSNASSVTDQITNLNVDMATYVDQAQKTAAYYTDVSDTGIALTSLATSTSIDNIINQLASTKDKYVNYAKNGALPDKMDKFNADLVDMLDALLTVYTTIKNNPNASTQFQDQVLSQFQYRIVGDAQASVIDEISFWKNNPSLSNYETLSSKQTDTLKALDKAKTDNNFFILDWMGVS